MYHYFAIFNYVLFFQHTQVQIGLILSQMEENSSLRTGIV